ncbi:glycosyltransferase [Ammonicoccus fulvus]|uniref:Glycosyltransferase n=1 Tax=Ammonicoccus fulvus TaxID=3138240 RepID=A0ABZ3FKC4_9ACTN
MTESRPDRPIKVLWLIKGLGPGGAEQLLLLAVKVADRERFDYQIAFQRPDKTHLIPEFRELGMEPFRLGAKGGRGGWLSDLRQLMQEVDIVHVHSPVLASVARMLSRSITPSRRPHIVVTEHNEWTSHRRPTRLLNALTTGLDAHHWAVSDQVVETMWPIHRKTYPVLIHGIDTTTVPSDSETRKRLRAELGVEDDAVLGITVANLRRVKDYPNLLNAARRAIDAQPRFRLICVGQGPLEAEIRALHDELGLGTRVQLLGFRRDVQDLMGAADLFVLGSAHEGLPIAVMEAFAAGLPVVATAVGGVPQQVREGREGLLVEPGNPQALADAIVRVVRDDDLRGQMAAAALSRSADYDIRGAVSEQERVYAALAGKTRR